MKHSVERIDSCIDLLLCVIEGGRETKTSLDAECPVARDRAVSAGAYGDTQFIEEDRGIIGMKAVGDYADAASDIIGGTEYAYSLQLRQHLAEAGSQHRLPFSDVAAANTLNISYSFMKCNYPADVRGPGFQEMWHFFIDRRAVPNIGDHSSAESERSKFLKVPLSYVQQSDAGRPQHLVGGEAQKVRVQFGNAYWEFPCCLRGVDQDGHAL